MKTGRNRNNAALLVALILSFCPALWALPDEIQVYPDSVNAPGKLSVELHSNYAIEGRRIPQHEGEYPPHHVLQFTPEFSLGLFQNMDIGLYLPMAADPEGRFLSNGARIRLKYLRPPKQDSPWFLGANVEVGAQSRRISTEPFLAELRPIFGLRYGSWLLALNPILDVEWGKDEKREVVLEPCGKLAYNWTEELALGVETYVEWGPLYRPLPQEARHVQIFLTADVGAGKTDTAFNIAVGRGYGPTQDRFSAKIIASVPLN